MKVAFEPQPSITAYELAWIYSRVASFTAPRYGIEITEEQWKEIPEAYKRHFRVMKPDKVIT